MERPSRLRLLFWEEFILKVLVTGVAGFIGSHLSEELAQLGHSVVGIDCLTNYYSRELKDLNLQQVKKLGVAVEYADLARDNLLPYIYEVDFIFHLAAQPGISAYRFADYERNNIQATYQLLEASIQSVCLKGFINIATSSIYGTNATGSETAEAKPTSFYGVTKLAAEQLVMSYTREKGFPACSLRLFSVYGPRERPEKLYPKLIYCIFSGKPFPLYEGSNEHLRSYSYVDDIIEGLIASMDNFNNCNGQILNIGTDTAITTGEGIAIVEGIIGKKANIEIKPKRLGDQLKTHANIEKSRKLIDYNPTTSPEVGLEKEVHWYKENVLGKIDPY